MTEELKVTPVGEIFDKFLIRVTDYDFIRLNDEDILQEILVDYLEKAIVRFSNSESKLAINYENMEIDSKLTLYEREILVTLMTLQYVEGKLMYAHVLEPTMSDKEYVMYSQANHIGKLMELKSKLELDASHLMSNYNLESYFA